MSGVVAALLLLCVFINSSNCAYFILSGAETQEFIVDTLHDNIVTIDYNYRVETKPTRGMAPIPASNDAVVITIEVQDPHQQTVSRTIAKELQGTIGFTAHVDGLHRITIKQQHTHAFFRTRYRTKFTFGMKVLDNMKDQKKDLEDGTEKQHIAVLTSSVSRLKDKVELIRLEQSNSKAREERFSTKYAGIGGRIVFFAVFQVIFFVGVGVWLMLNTKNFLIKSKVV